MSSILTPGSTNRVLTEKYYATLFDEDESLCLAFNAQGRSVYPLSSLDLESPSYEKYQYIAINPLIERRLDDNVTAYRNFLFENDKVPLEKQVELIKKSGLPYSACVFSGNKSFHFIVSLETPLENRSQYDYVWKWIYNILCKDLSEDSEFDKKTKNPSRFSRAPFGTNVKVDDNGVEYHRKVQKLIKVNGRIPDQLMNDWLMSHKDVAPVVKRHDPATPLSEEAQPFWLTPWTQYLLEEGIFNGKRNDEWHRMAFDFIECGFKCEEAIAYVRSHAKNMGDFPWHEVETCFRSAYKTSARRQGYDTY